MLNHIEWHRSSTSLRAHPRTQRLRYGRARETTIPHHGGGNLGPSTPWARRPRRSTPSRTGRSPRPRRASSSGTRRRRRLSAGGLAFLKRMLVVDPARRPGAGELLQDAYMRSAVPRATVLDTADLAKFAERRKKKFRPGQEKRVKFPTSKAPISAVFHSFRLILGRAIISRSALEAWVLFPKRARAEHSR